MKFDLEKRARELFGNAPIAWSSLAQEWATDQARRLAREALNAQAEEIAVWCKAHSRASGSERYWDGYRACAAHLGNEVRSLISKPEPEKTREQELEGELRRLIDSVCCSCGFSSCRWCRARRLLEKKP